MDQTPEIPEAVKGKIWLIVVISMSGVLLLAVLFIGTGNDSATLQKVAAAAIAFLSGLVLPTPIRLK